MKVIAAEESPLYEGLPDCDGICYILHVESCSIPIQINAENTLSADCTRYMRDG